MEIRKLVLTGGPCSGKTTVLGALAEEFRSLITLVPEVATILLSGGFPMPGKDLPWSESWQAAFQAAIVPLQRSFEDACQLLAQADGRELLVCDRGILDGAAYTPGGLPEFCVKYGVDSTEAAKRYEAVIHLESLATADPPKYGKIGNESRFEPLERARELEENTRQAWSSHPRHIVIEGRRGIEGKISETIGIVKFLLAERR